MGRKVMFLAEVSAIISMNIWSFEQYAGVWHGIRYIWSSCCPFCCIFSQYCRRQSLSSNVEMRLSTGLKAVTLSIKSTRFVRSWEHLRHWGGSEGLKYLCWGLLEGRDVYIIPIPIPIYRLQLLEAF